MTAEITGSWHATADGDFEVQAGTAWALADILKVSPPWRRFLAVPSVPTWQSRPAARESGCCSHPNPPRERGGSVTSCASAASRSGAVCRPRQHWRSRPAAAFGRCGNGRHGKRRSSQRACWVGAISSWESVCSIANAPPWGRAQTCEHSYAAQRASHSWTTCAGIVIGRASSRHCSLPSHLQISQELSDRCR